MASASYGKSESSSEMPKEMREIIKQGWEEMGDLRESLIGTFMGILSGTGKQYTREYTGTPGYWTEDRSGEVIGNTGGEGAHDIYGPGPQWVKGTGKKEWVEGEGAGAQIPMIARAQEAQRRATSQALTDTEESLAQKGIAGTPFAEMIMGQQRQQGASAVQGVESNIIQQIMGMIPGYTQGSASSIMGALPGTRESDAKAWNASASYGTGA